MSFIKMNSRLLLVFCFGLLVPGAVVADFFDDAVYDDAVYDNAVYERPLRSGSQRSQDRKLARQQRNTNRQAAREQRNLERQAARERRNLERKAARRFQPPEQSNPINTREVERQVVLPTNKEPRAEPKTAQAPSAVRNVPDKPASSSAPEDDQVNGYKVVGFFLVVFFLLGFNSWDGTSRSSSRSSRGSSYSSGSSYTGGDNDTSFPRQH